ncbi:YqeB family protein [Allokutzneria multivorans]|uniref:YqeB family protein n=1 Tax=Allokutzneria multivorans TaxID=1142134 RepID=UPI0031E813ED
MTGSGERVVAHKQWERNLLWFGAPALGAVFGWLVKPLAEWVLTLRWVPMQGPFKLAEQAPSWVLVCGGAVLGLGFAFLGALDMTEVSVSRERVVFRRGDNTTEVDGTEVDAVFLDGKRLVLLGPDGAELAAEKTDLPAAELREAFGASGYRWLDEGDPHAAEYRLWVEDTPDLPTGADALLKARKRAISGGESEDVRLLRSELGRLGVVVRDDGKRQYWRMTGTG